MIKTPVICPKGSRVVVTQGFKPGIHDSVDFIIWDYSARYEDNQQLTFGASFVAPFDFEVIQADWRDKTVGYYGQEAPAGGWIDIRGKLDDTTDIVLHFQHCSSIKLGKGFSGKAGCIIGNMGNSGGCVPAPTPDFPFDGTHCHLTVYTIKKGENAVRVNPFDYIDFTTWYEGADSEKSLDYAMIKWGLVRKGFETVGEKVLWLLSKFGSK